MTAVYGIQISILTMFVFCYYGVRTTEHCLNYANVLYDADWYKLSIPLQKCLMMMIHEAQCPLVYDGSYIVPVNLEIFTKVFSIQFF